MRILLVRPDLVDSAHSLFNVGLRHAPLGLLYLGTALSKAGHEVILCDEIAGDRADEDVVRHRPDLVGVTVSSPLVTRTAEITRRARAIGAQVVVGGPHVSALPEESLEETGADIGVVREGEDTIVEIASGAHPRDILGVVFKEGDRSVSTGFRPLNMDLDSIPIPDMSLLRWDKYDGDAEMGLAWRRGRGLIRIMSSRGCASHCTFCSRHKIFTREPRCRSPHNVLEEIHANLAVRPASNLVFMDDSFTQDFAHAERISQELLKARLGLTWAAITRVGIPRDLLELMYAAGCRVIELGVESGSPRILDNIKKNITVDSVVQTFREAREVGMRTKAFFMVGLPGEQRSDVDQSLALAKRINPDFLWLSIFLPLPGSEAFHGQTGPNADYRDRTFITSHDAALERRFREFLIRFYLRPGYVPVVLRNMGAYVDMARKIGALRTGALPSFDSLMHRGIPGDTRGN